jgi:hypothetical protein
MRRRPSNVIVVAAAGVEEAPVGVSFAGGAICAPAATVDGEGKLGAVKTVVQ